MRISKKIIAVVLSVLMAISMMPFTAFAADGTALSAVSGDANYFYVDYDVYLDDDYDTSKALYVSAYGGNSNITIDLNGHTFKSSADQAVFVDSSAGAITLTIKDSAQGTKKTTYTLSSGKINNMPTGKIECTGSRAIYNAGNVVVQSGAIVGTSNAIINKTNADGNNITVNGGYLEGGSYTISSVGTNCNITVNGGVVYGKHMGIGLNGNKSGNTINVTGGYVIGNTDASVAEGGAANAAIYFPGNDTLNITGGYVYGINSPAVVIRGGDVNISGGTITSTGDYQVTVASAATTVPTAAIVVDTEVDYPGAATMDVDISGGTITSTNADKAVAVVADEGDANVIDVTGGTYKANGAVDESIPFDDTVYIQDDFGKVFVKDDIVYTFTNTAGKVSYGTAFTGTTISSSGTYKLYKDVSVSARLAPGILASDVTFDLNGYNVTSTATDYFIYLGRAGTAASQKYFNIVNTSETESVITAKECVAIMAKYNNFTLGENVTLNVTDDYALTFHGTLKDTASAPTVQIDGTLNGGEAGIYAAGYANYVINGTVTGDTGIYQKGGNVVVNDGAVVTGTGADVDPEQNGSGFTPTGEGITVEETTSHLYGSTVINGGTISSDNADAVGSYALAAATDAGKTAPSEIIPADSTAVFSSDVSELAEDGYKTVYDETKGGYVVDEEDHSVAEVNGVKYNTFEEALAAISTVTTATHSKATDPTYEYKTYVANGEITLLKDCTTNGIIIGSGSDLTIDFNNKTLDITAKPVGSNGTETIGMQLLKDSDITFKDGTLTSTADSSEKIVRLIQNYSDLTLDNMTVGMKGYFYDQMTISNCNGEITITDSTVSAPDFSWIGYNAEQSAESLGARAMSIGSFSSTAYPDVNVTITNSEINGYVNIDNSAEGATAELTLNNSTVNGNIDAKAMDGATVTNNESTVSGIPENYEWVDNGNGTSSLVEKEPVAEDSATLAIGNETELVFHINADAHNATKIVVSAPDNTKENNTPIDTEYTNVSGEDYEIRVALAPSQIKERINVAIYNGSTLVEEYNYSIYDYCFAAVEDADYPADAKNLVKAFVNYAAASQKAVEWNDSGDYAINDDELYEVASATPSSVAHFSAIDGATLTSVAVICRNTTAVRFKYTGTINSATVSGIDGAEVVVYDDAIDVVGIPADKINDAFTLTINGTEITYSVDSWNATALTYFAADNANYKLANALAAYGAMADAYFA